MRPNPSPKIAPAFARRAAALALLAALSTLPRAEATAPFTDKIAIASHFATLAAAVAAAGEGGTLIVDQAYSLSGSLVLPSRFRLIGTGIQGDAVLVFPQLAGSGITIAPPRWAPAAGSRSRISTSRASSCPATGWSPPPAGSTSPTPTTSLCAT